jgi:hypothetical protein
MSQTSVLQIYALFSNSQIGVLFQILKSRAVSHFFNLTSNLRIPVIMNSVDADMSLKADLSLTYRNNVLDFVFILIPLENIFP